MLQVVRALGKGGVALWLFLLLLWAGEGYADPIVTARTEASLVTDVATVAPAQPFWAVLHIKLKEGWHTYWKNPGDSGISPTLNWTLPNGFSAGEVQYLAPERLPSGPLMDYGYNQDAYYLVKITPPALLNQNATVILMLKAQWLVCHEVCVPEKAEFSAVLPVAPSSTADASEDAPLVTGLVQRLPKPVPTPALLSVKDKQVHIQVTLPQSLSPAPANIQFFPETDGVINNTATQKIRSDGNLVSVTVEQGDATGVSRGEGVLSLLGVDGARTDYSLSFSASGAVAETTEKVAKPAEEKKILHPVSSSQPPMATAPPEADITLLSAIILALLGGVILNLMPCVLPILSLKVLSISKKAHAEAAYVRKQAFAYTSGVVFSFVCMATLLLVLQQGLGVSLGWGFQMQSPVFVSLLSVVMFLVGLNLSGAFELPVLMGNVAGGAASEDSVKGSFLTGVLAVLVATPCTAPFMAPAVGFALTQGGIVVLAVFTALGVGLSAPFLIFSVFPQLVVLLPRPGAWMLTLRQGLAFPIYLSVVWLLWVLAGETGADGLAIALMAIVLSAFCVFLLQRDSTFLRFLAVVLTIMGGAALVHYERTIPRTAMSSSEGREKFSMVRLEALRRANKPVLVDATAQWCITCKLNETVALSQPQVRDAFAKKGIVTLVADWTHGDEEITAYLKSFDRSGVPIYVYYPVNYGSPKVLPQLLTPQMVLDAVGETSTKSEPSHE